MPNLFWLILELFTLIHCVNSAKTKSGHDSAAALMNNKMSGAILQELDQDVNMVVSGFSLGNAMGMLLLGAKVSFGEKAIVYYEI